MKCEALGASLERSQDISWLSFYIYKMDKNFEIFTAEITEEKSTAFFAGPAVNVSFAKEEKYESTPLRLKEAV